MTVAELSDYWWVVPLLLMLVCCLACGKSCGCLGRRSAAGKDRDTA